MAIIAKVATVDLEIGALGVKQLKLSLDSSECYMY